MLKRGGVSLFFFDNGCLRSEKALNINQMMNQSRGATTSDLCTTNPILSRTGVGASDKIIFKDGTGKDDGKTSPMHISPIPCVLIWEPQTKLNVSQSNSEHNPATVGY